MSICRCCAPVSGQKQNLRPDCLLTLEAQIKPAIGRNDYTQQCSFKVCKVFRRFKAQYREVPHGQ